jgi:DNA-binding MarR family transcriptional regulator
MSQPALSDDDFRALAAFRAGLRQFLRFSEDAARAVGLTPQQHQLLVAVRGHAGPEPPTIGEIADALQIKHHSTVGMIDRMVEAGYIQRTPSTVDSRRVHIVITPAGEGVLHLLADAHRQEHRLLEDVLRNVTARFDLPS